MALENTDLMVVQKQDGGKEIRKASLQQLSDYIAASDTVVYKGLANFTQAGEEPGTRNTGDLYINNALADGTWQWSANSGSVTDVSPGDRCIWNGTNWDIIQSGVGDAGVETVGATLPLSVSGTDSEVVVESRQATTTLSGHVARLATEADVTATTGSGSATAVVTADLLKKSNEDILSATSGGLTSVQGIDPIEVHTDGTNSSTTNSPADYHQRLSNRSERCYCFGTTLIQLLVILRIKLILLPGLLLRTIPMLLRQSLLPRIMCWQTLKHLRMLDYGY